MKANVSRPARNRYILPSAILAAGVVLAVLGIWRGEAGDVLQKAVAVCLECIGIG